MALGMYFKPDSFSKERYDEAIDRLAQAGPAPARPRGAPIHFAFTGQDGGIQVFDVWESREQFDKFGETLVPIMTELGADPGEPMVADIHNVILG